MLPGVHDLAPATVSTPPVPEGTAVSLRSLSDGRVLGLAPDGSLARDAPEARFVMTAPEGGDGFGLRLADTDRLLRLDPATGALTTRPAPGADAAGPAARFGVLGGRLLSRHTLAQVPEPGALPGAPGGLQLVPAAPPLPAAPRAAAPAVAPSLPVPAPQLPPTPAHPSLSGVAVPVTAPPAPPRVPTPPVALPAPTPPLAPATPPLPGVPSVVPSSPAGSRRAPEDAADRVSTVIAVVADKAGATKAGILVRLLDGASLVDQTTTSERGVALLRVPPGAQPGPQGLMGIEVRGPRHRLHPVVFRAPDGTPHAVVDAVLDALPDDVAPFADDPFDRLPADVAPALLDDLLRLAGPGATGPLAGRDQGRTARQWVATRRVRLPRTGPDGRRYLVDVRQEWTFLGETLGPLRRGDVLPPGRHTLERRAAAPPAQGGAAPAPAEDALAPDPARPLPRRAADAWTSARGALRPTLEANELARQATLRPDETPAAPAGTASEVAQAAPAEGRATTLLAWGLVERHAVRSQVEAVHEVHAVPLPPPPVLGLADAVALRHVLAPALLDPALAPRFATLEETWRNRAAGQVPLASVQVEVAYEAPAAGGLLRVELHGHAVDVPLPRGGTRAHATLPLPAPLARASLDGVGLRLALADDAPPLPPDATPEGRLRRMQAVLRARAQDDQARRARVEVTGLALRLATREGEAWTQRVQPGQPLRVDHAQPTRAAHAPLEAVPAPPPAEADPLLRHLDDHRAHYALVLLEAALRDPSARALAPHLRALPPDHPLWRLPALGLDGDRILLVAPARPEDAYARALLEDPGAATVARVPLAAAYGEALPGLVSLPSTDARNGPATRLPLPPPDVGLGPVVTPDALPAAGALAPARPALVPTGIPGVPAAPAAPLVPVPASVPPAQGIAAPAVPATPATPATPAAPRPKLP